MSTRISLCLKFDSRWESILWLLPWRMDIFVCSLSHSREHSKLFVNIFWCTLQNVCNIQCTHHLFQKAHSFPWASFSENCSHHGTDNTLVPVNIFPPNIVFCLSFFKPFLSSRILIRIWHLRCTFRGHGKRLFSFHFITFWLLCFITCISFWVEKVTFHVNFKKNK